MMRTKTRAASCSTSKRAARTPARKDKARLENKIDDARKRLAAVRNQDPAPADAQSQFLSDLTRGFVDAAPRARGARRSVRPDGRSVRNARSLRRAFSLI